MAQSCIFCLNSGSLSKQQKNKSVIKSSHAIERYALDNKGSVGCFYDAWIDVVSSDSVLDKSFITQVDTNEVAQCRVLDDDKLDNDDLLQIIGVDNEQWLSIALDMTSVNEGIAMLHKYQLPTDRKIRFLHYHHISHQAHLSDNIDDIRHVFSDSLKNTKGTHIITSVKQGIDFVIAIEFSKNENSETIDSILRKVCEYFKETETDFLQLEEQEILDRCTSEVFSQLTEIRCSINDKKLSESCQLIRRYIFEHENDIPLYYTLHPVKCLSDDSNIGGTFSSLEPFIIERITKIMLGLYNKLKTVERLYDDILSSDLLQSLQTRFKDTLQKLGHIKDAYREIQNRLSKRVLKLRKGPDDSSSFDKKFKDIQDKALNDELDDLKEILDTIKYKARFIAKLQTKYCLEYFNVAELEDHGDDQRALDTKILSFYYQQPTHCICSSEKLKKNNTTQFDELCQQLTEEKKKNPSLRLVFADFTECSFKLPEMKLLPVKSKPPIQTKTKPSSIESNELNILLLGETGVGKSTFINAFANYFAFHSLDTAEHDGTIVVIPVSFTMTSSDQFDESEVKLGDPNNSNENFDNSGQTITQYCESYLFNLDNHTKLCIIDTPGIGDTRGLSQDDKNIQYILSYVNNLSHLNAICILLKPNVTRLHVLFRSCLDQIFNYLGPNARDNIIFCFTNSRSTFYLPGNTAPLLNKMLKDLPANHVSPLSKTNMFCFDSEAFRYLAAMKAGVNTTFRENQKAEFDISWNKSVAESIRLINSIKSCSQYKMNTWHSIKHVQIMITSLIQPILETVRNTRRNAILHETKKKQYSVELYPLPVEQVSYICTACPNEIKKIKDFALITRPMHQYKKPGVCDKCECEYIQHLPVLYELEYKSNTTKHAESHSKTEKLQQFLMQKSATFAHFLLHTARINEDPFLPWFDLFIREELHLCSQESADIINTVLHLQLVELKDAYQRQLRQFKDDQEHINIDDIYQWIVEVQRLSEIHEQMNVIKTSQMEIMKKHEHNISLQYPNIDMSRFSTDSGTVDQWF